MPKVLRIINRLNLGGPTYNAAYLSSYLSPEFETMLVAGMRDESEESSEFILDRMQLSPYYIHTMRREINFTDDRKAFTDIKNIIKNFKPDIVHTHAAKAGTLGRIAAYQLGVPIILHTFHGHVFHSYFNPAKTNIFIGIEKMMARLSTGIIAISEKQKQELSEQYNICKPEKIKTIPLGFDLSRFSLNQDFLRKEFRKKYHLSEDTLAVGIIGRLVPIKNHPLFIHAWKNLVNIYGKKIHAFIIGDGEDRAALEQLCKSIGLIYNTPEKNHSNASLTFTSWILEIETALAGIDIVALSSNNEGTPVSLIEAQAAGKPIVSTDAGALRDTIIPNETALIVPTGDEEAFTQSLSRLIADEQLRKRMSALGPEFASGKFGVERLVSDVRNYYNELLQRESIPSKGLYLPERPSIGEHPITVDSTAGKYPEIVTPVIIRNVKPRYKVLQIVNRLNLGGITYNAASIAARLRPEFETMIVAGIKEDSEESSEFMLENLGLEPVYIPDMMRELNFLKDRKAFLHLTKIIRDFKPDIVHTHAAKAGMVGRIAAWKANVPVIVHTFHGHVFHSYFGSTKTKMILEMERFLGKISSGIIAISENQKHELCDIYKIAPSSKVHIVELGYDLAPFHTDKEIKRREFRNRFSIDDDTVAIGIIGRIVPIKNLKLFIQGWHNVYINKKVKIKGLIIGDGEQRAEMQEFCEQSGIAYSCPEKPDPEAGLIFTSWIFEADKAMCGIDIIALTSLNEGTPASLIEAQAAGVPIISTNVGGVQNIVIPDVTAILVPTNDLIAFTRALDRLVNDEQLRYKMSLSGPAFTQSRFNYDRLTSDIRTLYHSLLKKH
ncbi:MAG: glycosyltransferase [Bacteroidetes bacterium]|jgi:glycosyltransferase involved in cell wall biosynthesis|nr:glycosyltransferase [Bacteroidota bacterium]